MTLQLLATPEVIAVHGSDHTIVHGCTVCALQVLLLAEAAARDTFTG